MTILGNCHPPETKFFDYAVPPPYAGRAQHHNEGWPLDTWTHIHAQTIFTTLRWHLAVLTTLGHHRVYSSQHGSQPLGNC